MTINKSSKELQPDEKERGCCQCCTARYTFVVLTATGLCINYFLRFNLSVAMVAMVTEKADSGSVSGNMTVTSGECPRLNHTNSNRTTTGEFSWNPATQGLILSSFFYGYCVMQIPGGWLSTRYGAKMVIGLSMLVMSLLTLLTPLAARAHLGVLIAVRAAEGLAGGAVFPAVHTMIGRWAPVNERSKMISLISLGPFSGVVVAFFATGWLCKQPFLGGWPAAFYLPGAVGCMWFIAWVLLIHSSPSKHPRISKRELNLIMSDVGENAYEKLPVPWAAMLTSPPFWAICVSFTCSAWGTYTLMTELPSFMKAVLGVDVSQSGLLSALPFAMSILFAPLWGYLADFLRERNVLSTTAIRKLMNTIATLGPASLLVLSNFVGCNQYVVAAVIAGATSFQVADLSASGANMIDIAPHLAGLIKSVCNTFATLTGIVSPYLSGVLVNDGQTKAEWSKVFYITSGVLVFDCIVFLIFASGEVQPWSSAIMDVEVSADKDPSVDRPKQYGSINSGPGAVHVSADKDPSVDRPKQYGSINAGPGAVHVSADKDPSVDRPKQYGSINSGPGAVHVSADKDPSVERPKQNGSINSGPCAVHVTADKDPSVDRPKEYQSIKSFDPGQSTHL